MKGPEFVVPSPKPCESITISVIIPVRNEERALPATLADLLDQEGEFETIVVDGDSTDGTSLVAREWRTTFRDAGRRLMWIRSAPGRAEQMNRGAKEATGEILLFLHADTLLPEGGLRRVTELLREERIVGGGFAHRFQEKDPRLRWVSLYSTWRGARRRSFYGDQALFLRRRVFQVLGGFRPMPFLEDLDLAKRLRRFGKVGYIPLPVHTSARRFLQEGILRSLVLMSLGKLFYRIGVVPAFLSRRYREIR